MTSRIIQRTTISRGGSSARPWLWTGLALTVLVTAASLLASDAIADHVQATYPSYSPAQVDASAGAYLAILTVVGALGVLGWLGTIWALARGARSAPWLATGLFLAALVIAVVGLTTQDTSGEIGLARLQGWLQILPCVAGALAVAALWRRR